MPMPPTKLTVENVTCTIAEWSKAFGVPATTIRSRLAAGWTPANAVRAPVDRRFTNRGAASKKISKPCPKLLRHRGTGMAYVEWRANGERNTRYFGRWGTDEANREYARFAAEWAGQLLRPRDMPQGTTATIGELYERYYAHCQAWYVRDGKPTSEIHQQRSACGAVAVLHGELPVDEFTPAHLRAVRDAWVSAGRVRMTVNSYQSRIVQMFGWGVGQSLVMAATWEALRHVERLQRGRSAAKDRPRKRAAPVVAVEAVMPHLHWHEGRRAVLESLVRVHWLIGGRPDDLCSMTPADLDREGDLWEYHVDRHKNLHRDKELVYLVGPKAQALLTPLLADCPADRPVFTYPPRRNDGRYRPITRLEYGRRVKAACEAAGITPWTPHQLRHSRATEVRRIYESNAGAAAVIGDSEDVTREIYTDPMDAVRRRIVRETG